MSLPQKAQESLLKPLVKVCFRLVNAGDNTWYNDEQVDTLIPDVWKVSIGYPFFPTFGQIYICYTGLICFDEKINAYSGTTIIAWQQLSANYSHLVFLFWIKAIKYRTQAHRIGTCTAPVPLSESSCSIGLPTSIWEAFVCPTTCHLYISTLPTFILLNQGWMIKLEFGCSKAVHCSGKPMTSNGSRSLRSQKLAG